MGIEEIKRELRRYADLYGNSLISYEDIDDCKNFIDFESIVERHRQHIEDMANDASNSLDKLKNRLGIT